MTSTLGEGGRHLIQKPVARALGGIPTGTRPRGRAVGELARGRQLWLASPFGRV